MTSLRKVDGAGSPRSTGIGIALSGGGIRAACLGLGALQSADKLQVFERARYVSAVSGGAYIATAFVASRAIADCAGISPLNRPWAPRSPEEQHLRRRLRYLGEDASDVLVGLVQYVVGAVLNLAPFAATIFIVFATLGHGYDAVGFMAVQGESLVASHSWERWIAALLIALAAAGIDRGLLGGSVSTATRTGALGIVSVLLLPDVLEVSSGILEANMQAVKSMAALIGSLIPLVLLVVRSQWAVQLSALRSAGLAVLRLLFTTATVLLLIGLATVAVQRTMRLDKVWVISLVILSLGVWAVFGLLVHANSTSLHTLYSRRLDRAFVAEASNDQGDTAPLVRLSQIPLADVYREGLAELVICAAVNLTGRESAEGEGCGSFVFSNSNVGGERVGSVPLDDYAKRCSSDTLTCASVIATSGAAVAPNMGIFTMKSLRAVLALVNLRLGLWLPNPGAPPVEHKNWLVARWLKPGPLSSYREALGALSRRHRFVFVSDGGHWENSGVVELMRRRCQTIFMVDAAVDSQRLGNLLRLITTARVDLGVEIQADSSLFETTASVLRIRFTYPWEDASSARNYLIIMRTNVSAEMPADLVALSRGSSPFPRHSTLNQFLRARDVDAYLALGRWLFAKGVELADLPPPVNKVTTGELVAQFQMGDHDMSSHAQRGW